MKIKILIEAYCPIIEDVYELISRFYNNYGEYANDFKEAEYDYDTNTKMVHLLYVGETGESSDDIKNELIRLTHHAEALYEDSDIEYTHVEVCVDNKWYGRE